MNINKLTRAEKAEIALLGRLSYEEFLEVTETTKSIGSRGKYNFSKYVVAPLYVDFTEDQLMAIMMG